MYNRHLLNVVIAAGIVVAPSHAEDKSWNNPLGGSFHDGLNWTPNGVPSPADVAVFELGTFYFVDFAFDATNEMMRIEDDSVNLAIGAGRTYTLTGTSSWSVYVSTTSALTVLSGTLDGVNAYLRGDVVIGSTASWSSSDSVDIDGAMLTVNGGSVEMGSVHVEYVGGITVTGASSEFTCGGNVVLGLPEGFPGSPGSFSITDGATATIGGALISDHPQNEVTLDTGALMVESLGPASPGSSFEGLFHFIAGTLTINDIFRVQDGAALGSSVILGPAQVLYVAGITEISPGALLDVAVFTSSRVVNDGTLVSSGDIAVGSPSLGGVYGGSGTLVINAGNTVTMSSAGFSTLTGLAILNNGTLAAPSGVLQTLGGTLQGSGSVVGRVASDLGTTIDALGILTVGDPDAFDGYFSDGILDVNSGVVTLHDRDEAVLGSLSFIGDDSAGGTLHAPNGLLLEAGKTVFGYGDITADLATDGFVFGEGPLAEDSLVLSGVVSGDGDFGGNIVFGGVYDPGSSPAAVEFENVAFTEPATLRVEIGGTVAGQEYDQLNGSDTARLGGTLLIELIDGFEPQPDDVFEIITAAQVEGEFDAEILSGPGRTDVTVTQAGVSIIIVPCPWDCEPVPDGEVGVTDFLALLAQWGTPGSCDFDGSTVEITDFLLMLGAWGPCP